MALKKEKKKNISNRIISVVLLGVIAFSGYNLYTGFQDYWKDYEKSLHINDVSVGLKSPFRVGLI